MTTIRSHGRFGTTEVHAARGPGARETGFSGKGIREPKAESASRHPLLDGATMICRSEGVYRIVTKHADRLESIYDLLREGVAETGKKAQAVEVEQKSGAVRTFFSVYEFDSPKKIDVVKVELMESEVLITMNPGQYNQHPFGRMVSKLFGDKETLELFGQQRK